MKISAKDETLHENKNAMAPNTMQIISFNTIVECLSR